MAEYTTIVRDSASSSAVSAVNVSLESAATHSASQEESEVLHSIDQSSKSGTAYSGSTLYLKPTYLYHMSRTLRNDGPYPDFLARPAFYLKYDNTEEAKKARNESICGLMSLASHKSHATDECYQKHMDTLYGDTIKERVNSDLNTLIKLMTEKENLPEGPRYRSLVKNYDVFTKALTDVYMRTVDRIITKYVAETNRSDSTHKPSDEENAKALSAIHRGIHLRDAYLDDCNDNIVYTLKLKGYEFECGLRWKDGSLKTIFRSRQSK